MRALRRPRHRRGPVARSTWPRRRRTTRHQTTRRLRRVFEQERRPFMLAIKELRPPAAACARSDRRQSREVRAVGRGRAQCDGLSEDGCAPARKPCLGRWTRPVEWWDVACGCSPPICSILRQDGRVLTIKIYLKICGRPSKFADQNLRWPGSKPVLWPTTHFRTRLQEDPHRVPSVVIRVSLEFGAGRP